VAISETGVQNNHYYNMHTKSGERKWQREKEREEKKLSRWLNSWGLQSLKLKLSHSALINKVALVPKSW